jgi:hypothetical protein
VKIPIIMAILAGLLLFGCTSQPQAPVPNSTAVTCAADLHTCPDGTYVARDPANNCQFQSCNQPAACTQEAKLCPDGSYVSRNSSKNCAFNDCPPVQTPAGNLSNQTFPPQQNETNQTLNNSTLAAEGESCAGVAAIACQPGLQCITSGQPGAYGTCTTPAPSSQDLQQCPSVRYANCTSESSPVCGKLVDAPGFRDYPNACQACSTSSNAIGYYVGTCANK